MSQAEEGYTKPDTSLLGDEHVRRYEETGGAVGHEWNGATCLVLTTTGRKTGQPRKFALIYASDGDNYLVVASMGGAPKHPGWYLNVVAHPEVTVQVLDRRFRANARTATAEERPRLWRVVNEVWPNYDVYARRTDRVIPIVVLEPVSDA
jgi:deazaflavin-dependent oxidoreductase (nitroreductase family)